MPPVLQAAADDFTTGGAEPPTVTENGHVIQILKQRPKMGHRARAQESSQDRPAESSAAPPSVPACMPDVSARLSDHEGHDRPSAAVSDPAIDDIAFVNAMVKEGTPWLDANTGQLTVSRSTVR